MPAQSEDVFILCLLLSIFLKSYSFSLWGSVSSTKKVGKSSSISLAFSVELNSCPNHAQDFPPIFWICLQKWQESNMKFICNVHKLIYQNQSTVRLMSSKIEWSKHLDASSKPPSFNHDKVTFLNMRYCPYAHRTALVLEAKQIP